MSGTSPHVKGTSGDGEGAQCSAGVVVAILVALAALWATASLGPVYRWLVVLRSHSLSRAVSSETALLLPELRTH